MCFGFSLQLVGSVIAMLDEWLIGINITSVPNLVHTSLPDVPRYDISSQPISFHIVLHRVLAGFLHEGLSQVLFLKNSYYP